MSDSLQHHGLQHAKPPCPSPTPGVYSISCAFSRWCHPNTSSSVNPFSSHLQSFPASGSFPMNRFFTWSGQSTGGSASASVLPMNTQDWFPLGWTGWISLQSKGLSYTDHVPGHALITWLIMHWSRDWSCNDLVSDHALITWLSCIAHVACHAVITWLSCTTHLADHAMIM